jgi:hypothetical protein
MTKEYVNHPEWRDEILRCFTWLKDPPVNASEPSVEYLPELRDYTEVVYRTPVLTLELCVTGWEQSLCLIIRYHDIEYPKYSFPSNAVLEHDIVADTIKDPQWRTRGRGSALKQVSRIAELLRRYQQSILIGNRAEYDRVKAVGKESREQGVFF